MTNREYITTVLSKFNINSAEVDIILLENDLNGNDNVDIKEAKTAIYKNLSIWLPVMSSVQEGGVQETWNFGAVQMYYSTLCSELGLENVIADKRNSIQDKSDLW